jgi:hypothetical protein
MNARKHDHPVPGLPAAGPAALLAGLRELIAATRQSVAQGVNSALVLLYWQIGQRIRSDILNEKRAGYGEQIVHAVSAKLAEEFGRGFTARNLFNMLRFAETFPDREIVHALSAQLSWTHLRRIIYLDDPLQRDFYAEMCRIERWNTHTLHQKIQYLLFEQKQLIQKLHRAVRLARQRLQAIQAGAIEGHA